MPDSETSSSGLALYTGSFDPFTNGHMDIVRRSAGLFDHVEVMIATNTSKKTLLGLDERLRLIRECTRDLSNVSVAAFDGLLADYARKRGAKALVRGLRQVSDFDYEFRMAFANRRLAPDIETVFLMTSEEHMLISSSIVREIVRFGGDVSTFVPAPVLQALNGLRG